MPELVPIASKEWVVRRAGKALRQMYGANPRLRLFSLPCKDIYPEDLAKTVLYDVELMLACLQSGAWLNGENWQTYARYAIAKRLRVRSSMIFIQPFAELKEAVLDYQLNGGTFKTRDAINRHAGKMLTHTKATPHMKTCARLLLSLTDEIQVNTLIQPFHWIRCTIAATETNPVFAMALISGEMHKQKVALCKMLRATLDS